MFTMSPLVFSVLILSIGLLDSIICAMLANLAGEIAFRNQCLVYVVIFMCVLHYIRSCMKKEYGVKQKGKVKNGKDRKIKGSSKSPGDE